MAIIKTLKKLVSGKSTTLYPRTVFDAVIRKKSDGTTETLTEVIDNLPSGGGSGGSVTVDSALSSTSTNPVQNKVITAAMSGKADSSAVPTKVSQLTNDSGFLTEHQSLAAYRTSADQDIIDSAIKADISTKADADSVYTKTETSELLSGKQDAPTTAGTSGQVLGLDDNLAPVWVDQTGGGSAEEEWETIVDYSDFPSSASVVNDILGDFKFTDWEKVLLQYYMPSGVSGKQAIMAYTPTSALSRFPMVSAGASNANYKYVNMYAFRAGDYFVSIGNAEYPDSADGAAPSNAGGIVVAPWDEIKTHDDAGYRYCFVDWGNRAVTGATLKMIGVRA